MQLRVWGMTPDDMQKMFTLGLIMLVQKRNQVTLKAGDVNGNLSTVYIGTIQDGYFDAADMPNVCFHVSAFVRGFDTLKPADAITLKGPVDVAQALSSLAGKMSPVLQFENNGVDVKLPDTYLPGTMLEKIQKLAEAAHIEYIVDDDTLAIWPKGSTRKGNVLTVSASTGMIGYPSFTGYGIVVSTLYDPRLKFGAMVEIQSSLKAASKKWRIFTLTYELESEMPGGNWICRFQACPPEFFEAASIGGA